MKTFTLLVAISLSLIAYWRTPFSLEAIAAPLIDEEVEKNIQFDQIYHFLGKGRQSFAFLSQDGKTVLKFFKKDYFRMPWYSFILRNKEQEKNKRERRKRYFLEGYPIAEKYLAEQTALLYVHYGKTKNLPKIRVKDQANRYFTIDLNQVPFILQKKGEPIFPYLQRIYESQGKEGVISTIEGYLKNLRYRISLGIADGDHNIEHNYGFIDDQPVHLDPGRLYMHDFVDKNSLDHEWWVGTHELKKWLNQTFPEMNLEHIWNPSF